MTALGDVCSAIQQLPASAVIPPGKLEKRGEFPLMASKGRISTWEGNLDDDEVEIKCVLIYTSEPLFLKEVKKVSEQSTCEVSLRTKNLLQVLYKQVPMLMKLSHNNIVPFRGVDTTRFELALVYDAGYQGYILDYMKSHPQVSPSLLVCKILLL